MPGGRVLVRLSCAGLGVHCAGYPFASGPAVRRNYRRGRERPRAGGRGRDRPELSAVVLGHGSCRRWTAWPLLRASRSNARKYGQVVIRHFGHVAVCAAWQAGRQLSRGGGDRRRHRTPKAHGEAHRQLQARQRAPVSEVADPPLSPTRTALWRSVFGRARGRPDDEKVSPCCPIHHSTNGVVTPRLDLCGATDDLLDHARVAKAVKELGDAFLD